MKNNLYFFLLNSNLKKRAGNESRQVGLVSKNYLSFFVSVCERSLPATDFTSGVLFGLLSSALAMLATLALVFLSISSFLLYKISAVCEGRDGFVTGRGRSRYFSNKVQSEFCLLRSKICLYFFSNVTKYKKKAGISASKVLPVPLFLSPKKNSKLYLLFFSTCDKALPAAVFAAGVLFGFLRTWLAFVAATEPVTFFAIFASFPCKLNTLFKIAKRIEGYRIMSDKGLWKSPIESVQIISNYFGRKVSKIARILGKSFLGIFRNISRNSFSVSDSIVGLSPSRNISPSPVRSQSVLTLKTVLRATRAILESPCRPDRTLDMPPADMPILSANSLLLIPRDFVSISTLSFIIKKYCRLRTNIVDKLRNINYGKNEVVNTTSWFSSLSVGSWAESKKLASGVLCP